MNEKLYDNIIFNTCIKFAGSESFSFAPMIFKSKYSDIDIPGVGVYQYGTSNPNGIPDDKAILIDGLTDKKVTFGELKSNSKKLAAGLQTIGFKRGDVDYHAVVFGAIAAGGIVSPANPLYKVGELTFQLIDSGASIIFAHPNYLSTVVKAAEEANIPKSKIFLFEEEEVDGFQPYCSLIGDHVIEPVSYTPEEARMTTAFLCYSSGTVGKPKGVETTHTNIVANVAQLAAVKDSGTEDIFMGVLPFFHIYELNLLVFLTVIVGGSTIVIPKFDIEKFCYCIEKYKINYAHVAPPIVLSLAKNPAIKRYNISSLRMLISAAAPLGKESSKEFSKILKIPIKQGYGLTEMSPATHLCSSDNIVTFHIHNNSIGSIGCLLPNVEAKLVSVEGLKLGPNEGEICVRGPNVMKGYLNNDEATKASFDEDGFFHTEDIARVDENNRVKELIKYMGYQVAPAELEAILLTYPAIADAAVIGCHSERSLTEYPTAYVVTKPGHKQTRELKSDIQKHISEKVVPHKKLRGGIYFTDQIPKSPTGKILRRILREKLKKEFVDPLDKQ
ncbi:22491_t:CDS:10 [Dentiscutata erythropus]|uniref:22491_t:CDS:1 n=1 Tax=Dentiscutata erythropus TaxID=1348616 RepID=A0A9N9JK40_9GLOM|nr:22491_t:CDS:10 [Dentiscutata erythropus]